MKLSEAIEIISRHENGSIAPSTSKGYNQVRKYFAVFMRDKNIEDVRTKDIDEYFDLLRRMGIQNKTFIKMACGLRTMFDYFFHQPDIKVLDPWNIPIPKREFGRPRIANREALLELLDKLPNDAIGSRDRAIIGILIDGGVRVGEVTQLKIKDVDFRENTITINTEKSRGTRPFRVLPLSRKTMKSIQDWIQYSVGYSAFQPSTLFFSMGRGSSLGKPLLSSSVAQIMMKRCKEAEIEYINPHSIRHMNGREIIKSGGSTADVMNKFGHVSVGSSSVYLTLFGDSLVRRLRKFIR